MLQLTYNACDISYHIMCNMMVPATLAHIRHMMHRGHMTHSMVWVDHSDRKEMLITARKHTFSAFWLRSSVVSVLISLISDTEVTDFLQD
jgi:hypothetical protein